MGYWEQNKKIPCDEWYTPKYILDALACRFDMDVAGARYGTPEGALEWIRLQNEELRRAYEEALHEASLDNKKPKPKLPEYIPIPNDLIGSDCIPADLKITDGGLEAEWRGFIWMNPPYGGRGQIQPWLRRFFSHGNGIAVVPDRTSAPWWQEECPGADLILVTSKVCYTRPDGSLGKSPSNGTALIASGERGVAALHRGAINGLGMLLKPVRSDQQLALLHRSAA